MTQAGYVQRRHDWVAIRREYAGGDMSLDDLAAKHGISAPLVRAHSAEESWPIEREAVRLAGVRRKTLARVQTEEQIDALGARVARGLLHRVRRAVEAIDPETGKRVDLSAVELATLARTAEIAHPLLRRSVGLPSERVPQVIEVRHMDGRERLTALQRVEAQIARALEASQRIEVPALPDRSEDDRAPESEANATEA